MENNKDQLNRSGGQGSDDGRYPTNKDQQAVDKAPGEEVGKSEQVTQEDLKGKKVDREPGNERDEPIDRK